MPDSPTDADLLRLYAAADDADAFGVLVRRHRGLVYGTCVRTLGGTASAEDATQDAFVKLMKHAGAVESSLPAWLHRVAVNACRDVQRSEAARRARERVERPVSAERTEPVDLAAERHELEDRLDAALDELPEDDRALLVEHFLREVPQSVIAEREGVSRPTLSRRVGRALVALRERVGAATPAKRRDAVTAAATLGVLLFAGRAHAAGVPGALAETLNRLTMLSGSTASGIVDATPAPPPPVGVQPRKPEPSPLTFALVFLVPLGAMLACGVAAVALYAASPTGQPRLEGTTEGPRPPLPRETAATPVPGRVFAVPGAPLLRSDRIASFTVDGGSVSLAYGDGRVETVLRPEADRRLRDQTGRSLLDLMLASP